MTDLVGLAKCNHYHANATLNTIKSLLENADLTNPNCWVHKINALGADGASIDIGTNGGIGAYSRREIGEHAPSILSISYWLELAMLSTQRSVPMIE